MSVGNNSREFALRERAKVKFTDNCALDQEEESKETIPLFFFFFFFFFHVFGDPFRFTSKGERFA